MKKRHSDHLLKVGAEHQFIARFLFCAAVVNRFYHLALFSRWASRWPKEFLSLLHQFVPCEVPGRIFGAAFTLSLALLHVITEFPSCLLVHSEKFRDILDLFDVRFHSRSLANLDACFYSCFS